MSRDLVLMSARDAAAVARYLRCAGIPYDAHPQEPVLILREHAKRRRKGDPDVAVALTVTRPTQGRT